MRGDDGDRINHRQEAIDTNVSKDSAKLRMNKALKAIRKVESFASHEAATSKYDECKQGPSRSRLPPEFSLTLRQILQAQSRYLHLRYTSA